MENCKHLCDQNTLTVNFLKGEPVDDDPKIVEEGERHNHGPIVTKPTSRVEYERPIRSTPKTPARVR